MATLYERKGNYEVAIEEYKKILTARAERGLQNHPDNALLIDNMVRLELMEGKYAAAESYIQQLLHIRKATPGEQSLPFATALNQLSSYYIELGNYEKAEQTTRKVLELLAKNRFDSTYEYANAVNDMGRIMYGKSKHPESLACFEKASVLYEHLGGKENDTYVLSINNIGSEHDMLGNYYRAETAFRQALDGLQKLKSEGYLIGFYRTNLGGILRKTGKLREAEQCISEALLHYDKLRLSGTPNHITAEIALAQLYLDAGKMEEAEALYLKVNQQQLLQIHQYFGAFSELEKERFYAKLVGNFDMFNSFCQLRSGANPSILEEMYNNQLTIKALLLNSSAKWKQRIKSSHDRKLLLRFTEWEEYRNRLNRLYQSTDSTERLGIDSLEEKAAHLEKDLAQRSEHFAELADKRAYTWKDVQAKLKPGEAVIEMVRFSKYGTWRTLTDTSNPAKPVYKEKGLTDTIYYAALLVKPGMQHPELILLQNGKELEGRYLNQYKNLIRSKSPDDKSYNQFWKKIADRVKECGRIYLSPDGVFHQINLNTLYNPATRKYLLEEKDIRLVTVTKDLLIPKREETENKLAYLFGRPSYYHTATEPVLLASIDRKSPAMEYTLDIDSTHTLADLPGTEREVNQLETLLSAQGWEIHNLRGEQAMEENLKESYKPRLLHIATHGYFQTDSSRNPLLRSGLMLAGAGKTVAGKKNQGTEDGILTAYEAMNLNLDNTDLVVLSACETGLGEIKNGEGVYGLQRAFKVAGAKSIIMSLWKVDDEATQELMVSFYKNWLGPQTPEGGLKRQNTNSKAVSSPPSGDLGGRKRVAFLKAQKELKAKYPNPYYWGAFVMVGE